MYGALCEEHRSCPDGDVRSDLAVPSLDRRALRLIVFTPQLHDIARVPLPTRVATNIAAVKLRNGIALIAGLENGQLVLIHETTSAPER